MITFVIESKNGAKQFLAAGNVWTHVRSQALTFEDRLYAQTVLDSARAIKKSQIFLKAKIAVYS